MTKWLRKKDKAGSLFSQLPRYSIDFTGELYFFQHPAETV